MPLIVPDLAEPAFLQILVSTFLNGFGTQLKLFKNNVVPSDASILSTFTEADFSGYAAASPTWSVATEVANKAQTNDSMPRVFSHSGGGTANTIYGYYVVSFAAPYLLWAERFPAPITMSASGDTITITAQLTLDSEFH
jgi:hypothetical protein